jgi:hypothetical protein
MKKQELAPGIVIIRDVLTADECKQMITFAEARGFDPATIIHWVCNGCTGKPVTTIGSSMMTLTL